MFRHRMSYGCVCAGHATVESARSERHCIAASQNNYGSTGMLATQAKQELQQRLKPSAG